MSEPVPQYSPEKASDRIESWVADSPSQKGYLYLDGVEGAGKTELLRRLSRKVPSAVFVDATGMSAEEVVDRVMQDLGVSYSSAFRDLGWLSRSMEDHQLNRVVFLANTQWSGATRTTADPQQLTTPIVSELGYEFRRTGVRFVAEMDTTVAAPNWWAKNLTLNISRPSGNRISSLGAPRDVSPRQLVAVRALVFAEPRRIRFEEWGALCAVLGTNISVAELRTIADASPLVTVDDEAPLPVGLAREPDARRMREDVPVGMFRAFQDGMVTRLLQCDMRDPLIGYMSRALPAHAAAAGRFEEFLNHPRALVRCSRSAVMAGLGVAFQQRPIPAGSLAAELHYLEKSAPAPCSQAEWVSLLHHTAMCWGHRERADALADAGGPLPWQTVWTQWRPGGYPGVCGTWTGGAEYLEADVRTGQVTSTNSGGTEQTWDVATGELVGPDEQGEAGPSSFQVSSTWRVEPTAKEVRLELADDSSSFRVVQAPGVDDAVALGDLVVIGGRCGLYAIAADPAYVEAGEPSRPMPVVGPRGRIAPRFFDEEACRPTRGRLVSTFSAASVPMLAEEQLPDGLTDVPSRRFLTEVGFPAVSDFYSLDTHHLLETALEAHAWETGRNFETAVGEGPFYKLGTWIGGILLLDGSTGRVLRQTTPQAVDSDRPGDPLAGSSLASFVAMICLHWQRMLGYSQAGGVDGADVLDELKAWLSAIDAPAAATRNWGHVLEADNFYYL